MDKTNSVGPDISSLLDDSGSQQCIGHGGPTSNGLCPGTVVMTESGTAATLKQGDCTVGTSGVWTTPVMRVETCGTLPEDWQEDEEGITEKQRQKDPDVTLGENLDMKTRKTASLHSFQNKIPGTEENDQRESVWKVKTDSLEVASQCVESPVCPEDASRPGFKGDNFKTRSKDDGMRHDNWEQFKSEGNEEDIDGDGAKRSEGRRDSEMNDESGSQKCGGGRRGRGRNVSEQSQQPITFSFSKPLSSSGGRHKQARRRHHHHHHHQGRSKGHLSRATMACREFLSESLPPWCLSCFRMVVELIVLVAHQCGEVVEAGGAILYDFASQLLGKAKDLHALKAEGLCLLGRMYSTGAALLGWSAVLAMQMSTACLSFLSRVVLLKFGFLRGFLGKLGGERANKWLTAFLNSYAWKCTAVILKKIQSLFWRNSPQTSSSTSESTSGVGRCHPGKELERLLGLSQIPEDELNPFVVLGVEENATDPELKRAYRQLAVQVHPDKNKHPRAGEAFKVLRAAWDIVSNPETYRQYQLKRMAETELSRSMNEFLTKLQDDLKEAMNTMMCTKCEGKHKRFEIERDPGEARYCAECNKHHSAEEGDLWAESSMLGLRITYFSFMDGKVYDITEWAGCQRISITPDTHRVPYHISFGAKSSNNTRHRSPSEHYSGPHSPADLQDFISRIFQGGPPSSMAANGGFFPSATSPHRPAGSGNNSFSASPPHPGFFTPGGQRSDSCEPRTDGSKPVRRRKKVRKPFQR
ncbi:hypothetical protein GN956_G5320 [Arapaima gigas]